MTIIESNNLFYIVNVKLRYIKSCLYYELGRQFDKYDDLCIHYTLEEENISEKKF